ncbi:MAG: porin family protein [Elusimicrobiota bacterium]|nr:porin family protein [Elusimicrobiota bacterium]
MKKMIIMFVAVVLVIPLFAQEASVKPYISFKAGLGFINYKESGYKNDDIAPILGTSLGISLAENLRIEGEYLRHTQVTIVDASFIRNELGLPVSEGITATGDSFIFTILFNKKFSNSDTEFVLGAGIGRTKVKASFLGYSDSENNFTYSFYAGIAPALSEDIKLDLGIHYVNMSGVDYDLYSISPSSGLRFMFN